MVMHVAKIAKKTTGARTVAGHSITFNWVACCGLVHMYYILACTHVVSCIECMCVFLDRGSLSLSLYIYIYMYAFKYVYIYIYICRHLYNMMLCRLHVVGIYKYGFLKFLHSSFNI